MSSSSSSCCCATTWNAMVLSSCPVIAFHSPSSICRPCRDIFDRGDRKGQKMPRNSPPLRVASLSASLPGPISSKMRDHRFNYYLEVLRLARSNFMKEISFQSKDKDISLARALLYVAVEDEAFMAFNRDIDSLSRVNEMRENEFSYEFSTELDCLDSVLLCGRGINEWLNEFDLIAKEVQAELVSRNIGCHLLEILEAVNRVLFESRRFKRHHLLVDSKFSYLHTVLTSGCGSEIMLRVIYIEVCQRLGITIAGSRVGEDFLIWPVDGSPEELFMISSGHDSIFAKVNGKCVEDPMSKASDLDSKSLRSLDIATNRDIIEITLANLIRLHWKSASRRNHGLMLTSPLRPASDNRRESPKFNGTKDPLLRPQDLRLAIMASERLLILQPHSWSLRRDHGMLLFYSRRYREAVQELSICMAFAPVEEAEILEHFVEKLHLLRRESSWEKMDKTGSLPIP